LFQFFTSNTGSKSYEEIDVRLQELYLEAETIMASSDKEVEAFKTVLLQIKNIYAELELITIKEPDESRKENLMSSM